MTIEIRQLVLAPARTTYIPVLQRPAAAPLLVASRTEPAVLWIDLSATRACHLSLIEVTSTDGAVPLADFGDIQVGARIVWQKLPLGLSPSPAESCLVAAGARHPVTFTTITEHALLMDLVGEPLSRLPSFAAATIDASDRAFRIADQSQRSFAFVIHFSAPSVPIPTAPPSPAVVPKAPRRKPSLWRRLISPLDYHDPDREFTQAKPAVPHRTEYPWDAPPTLTISFCDRRCAGRWPTPTILTPRDSFGGARAYYADPHDRQFADITEFAVASRSPATIAGTILTHRQKLAAVISATLTARCTLNHEGLEIAATTTRFPDSAIADWCEAAIALSNAL